VLAALSLLRAQSRAVQVLMLNELSINIGFFMMFPYLAGHLRDGLGLSAWMVGMVMGIRVLSQQGLTVIGGTAADRLGYKPVITTGLALRSVGFALFGLADGLGGVLAGAVLSGLGGALFSPALRAYIAVEGGERRAQIFAIGELAGQLGMLLGPVIGVWLLGFGFRAVCLGAAATFLALGALQLRYLPRRVDMRPDPTATVWSDWGQVLANRRFLLFALAMVGAAVMHHQLYLGLPLEARRLTGGDTGTSVLFVVASVLTLAVQLPLNAWCAARYRPGQAVALGLLVMALAFVPPIAFAGAPAALPAESSLAGTAAVLAPLLLAACLISLGDVIRRPFALSLVPQLANHKLVGTYFGFYTLASGLGTTVGNTAMGLTFDLQSRPELAGLPWLCLIALGTAAGAFVRRLDRRGLLR